MTKRGEGRIRRVCYVDAALISNVGHHANACRHISAEFRRRGIEVDILANASVENGLIEELGAKAAFHHNPYARISRRRSMNFRYAKASFLTDLCAMTSGRTYDLVYANSVLPAQMAAMIHWGQTRFSAASMPPLAIEFGLPSGTSDRRGGNWGQYAEYYPVAASALACDYLGKFLFFTFDAAASTDYSCLLGIEVDTLPTVHTGGDIRLRTGDEERRPVVGFLGHQRLDKGYHLIPNVLRLLLQRDINARFLVHNGDMHETIIARELRDLAGSESRVCFEHRPADQAQWNKLLDSTDIVVLPYDPTRFSASYSAVAVEAVSCGLPIVSPNGTTMKTIAERYQNNSSGITDWTVEAITEAIVKAVQNFPILAQSAYEGARKWVLMNGASAFVERLLDFAETHASENSVASTHPLEPATRCLAYIAEAKLKLRASQKQRRALRRRPRHL